MGNYLFGFLSRVDFSLYTIQPIQFWHLNILNRLILVFFHLFQIFGDGNHFKPFENKVNDDDDSEIVMVFDFSIVKIF